MIDPLVSLSFTIHSSPGVYALLLGSGVSRSSNIPTGWEITLDLIRKIAHLEDENPEPDPINWFVSKFGKEPDYSELLEAIAKTPTERNKLLRSYFEPTDEEREASKKIPSIAHRAIANLVKEGHIKLIFTTNFDRLIEIA